jgi:hypothetical protein
MLLTIPKRHYKAPGKSSTVYYYPKHAPPHVCIGGGLDSINCC